MIKLIDIKRDAGDTSIRISDALDLIPERRKLLKASEDKVFRKYYSRITKWVDDLNLMLWTEKEAQEALSLAFFKLSLIDIWNDIVDELYKHLLDLDATEYIYLAFNIHNIEAQLKTALNDCRMLLALTDLKK